MVSPSYEERICEMFDSFSKTVSRNYYRDLLRAEKRRNDHYREEPVEYLFDLNIRKGPGTNYAKTGKYTGKGVFTIVEEADGQGASRWGLLKSYQKNHDGWISLDYGKRV